MEVLNTNDGGARTAGQQGSPPIQVPSIGRIVHYVLPVGEHAGEHRPAIIVRVFGDQPTSAVNLQVFTDGKSDGILEDYDDDIVHVASATYAAPEDNVLRSYHFPEYVAPQDSKAAQAIGEGGDSSNLPRANAGTANAGPANTVVIN